MARKRAFFRTFDLCACGLFEYCEDAALLLLVSFTVTAEPDTAGGSTAFRTARWDSDKESGNTTPRTQNKSPYSSTLFLSYEPAV